LLFTAEVIIFTILLWHGIRHWSELVHCCISACSTAHFFVSSSGTFLVVVTAAAVLVLIFTSYFSIYTFQPLQLYCLIAFFTTFFNTKFIRIAVSSQYIICGII
jgi:hypothetical protein